VAQPQTVDIHDVVETQEKGFFPVAIFLMCCLVMLVDGFNQQSLNYAAPAIIEALGISPALMTGLVADINIFGWMLGAVGFSMLAAAQVPVLLGAMQPRHERAAGEWQAEWDALPMVATATAGAVSNALDVARGLRVDPDRMRANLDLDGGMIMAEAAMMALAPVVGRGPAHDMVYEACTRARTEHWTLLEALTISIPPAVAVQLPPLEDMLQPAAYLGEAVGIADRGIATWRAGRITQRGPGGPARGVVGAGEGGS